MRLNKEVPSEGIQCLKTMLQIFPCLGLKAHAPPLITMLTTPIPASGGASELAVIGASRKTVKELLTTTTNPVLMEICELFLSPPPLPTALTRWQNGD